MQLDEIKDTLFNYHKYLQVEKGKSTATCNQYLNIVQNFLQQCHERPDHLLLPLPWRLEHISPESVHRFLQLQPTSLKHNSQVAYINALRSFIKFLLKTGRLHEFPLHQLSYPAAHLHGLPDSGADNATEDALWSLNQYFEQPPAEGSVEVRNRLLMEVFYRSGLSIKRVHQITHIEACHEAPEVKLHLQGEVIQLRFSEAALACLRQHQRGLDEANAKHFWMGTGQRRMAYQTLVNQLKAIHQSLGIEVEQASRMRTLAEAFLLQQGMDQRVLRNLRGQKTLTGKAKADADFFELMENFQALQT